MGDGASASLPRVSYESYLPGAARVACPTPRMPTNVQKQRRKAGEEREFAKQTNKKGPKKKTEEE